MCGSMVKGGPLTVNQSGGSCAGQDSISWPPWSAIPESLRPPFHQELQERKGLLWWVCFLHGSLGGMLSWQVRRPMHQQRQEFCLHSKALINCHQNVEVAVACSSAPQPLQEAPRKLCRIFVVCGSTGSGKMVIVQQLVENHHGSQTTAGTTSPDRVSPLQETVSNPWKVGWGLPAMASTTSPADATFLFSARCLSQTWNRAYHVPVPGPHCLIGKVERKIFDAASLCAILMLHGFIKMVSRYSSSQRARIVCDVCPKQEIQHVEYLILPSSKTRSFEIPPILVRSSITTTSQRATCIWSWLGY